MKDVDFHYHRAETVEEAVDLLARFGDEAKVLAGGQSLLPIMHMRLAGPAHLVDIGRIAELKRAGEDGAGARYGATTTHMAIEHGLVPDATAGLLPTVAAGIGYRAIRTRGTVGGSLAHADTSAEWPIVLSALDARVHTRSPRGRRTIPVRELLLGFFSTSLEPDELITEVEVPRLPAGTRWGFQKTARKPGEFAESLGVALCLPEGVQLWVGAARETPSRLGATERAVAGRIGDEIPVDDLVEPVAADIGVDPAERDPIERHRLQLHAVTIQRALKAAEQEPAHA